MHAYGGRGLTENYLGTQKSNNGTGALWNFGVGLHLLDEKSVARVGAERGALACTRAT